MQTEEEFFNEAMDAKCNYDQGIGHAQRINKAAAHGLQVKGSAACRTELVLQNTGGRWEHHVGRAGGHDDQVDVLCRDTGSLQCIFGGFKGEVAAEDTVGRKVAGPDTGALHNPVIGRLDAGGGQLSHQIGIGQPAGRQVAASACDAGIWAHR